MTAPDANSALDPLFDEALEWIARMSSGEMTAGERRDFARWRRKSTGHEQAFRQASAVRHGMRLVSLELVEEDPAYTTVVPLRWRTFDRRAMLRGGLAASAAGVLAVIGGPPLLSLFSRKPDYETGIGERRQIALAPGLHVQLDSRSSIAVAQSDGRHRIELLGGRAAIDARLDAGHRVEVVAGRGQMAAIDARFDVESDHDRSCVTCVSGSVGLSYGSSRMRLGECQQVVYTDTSLGQPALVDVAAATAWATGQLVFLHTPLNDVVREVNRYRPGRIVIVGSALGARQVSGAFETSHIEDAVGQIEQISGARATRLPGGLVIFS